VPIGKPYPPELRERSVRMVYKWREARAAEYSGFAEAGEMLGVHRESVRNWVRQHEIDGGSRAGHTSDDRARIAQSERENRELRRANEILKSAAFGARPPTAQAIAYIDGHRGAVGGRADLQRLAGSPLQLLRARSRPPCRRQVSDETLKGHIALCGGKHRAGLLGDLAYALPILRTDRNRPDAAEQCGVPVLWLLSSPRAISRRRGQLSAAGSRRVQQRGCQSGARGAQGTLRSGAPAGCGRGRPGQCL
jgi:transposase